MSITLIKVWVQLENSEPEKIEIRADADIDDLKNKFFTNDGKEKRHYYTIYNNMKLLSSAQIPHDTSGTNPIMFVRIGDDSLQEKVDGTDDFHKTITHLKTDTDRPLHSIETIHYENGDKYVGEVNNDKEPNGKGTMLWKNGRRYEGYWRNGKKDGSGVEYGANGAVNFLGQWKDDELILSADQNV